MKISNEKRVVETDGFDNKPIEFGIQMSPKAFEVLSSNIYSDKILAVVREYGTNALDAHIMVDKIDVPFEVHLPNTFEPWFSIRDFGPGLSDENISKIYTTYFHSTKEDDNDVTGCLGLGSKSAFAYTDQFTITSRFEGMKRVYTAYIDQDGGRVITKITEEPTDQEAGLEIYMSVKPADFRMFADRAQMIFHRFPTLPIISGAQCDLKQVKYTIIGPNYKVREQGQGCYAIQGSVAYPINVNALERNLFPADVGDRLNRMLSASPIDIVFPLGELNITASREALNYDKRTQANIIKAALSVFNHLPSNFEGQFKNIKTEWEAKKALRKLEKNYQLSQILEVVRHNIEWNGKKLTDTKTKLSMKDMVPSYIDGKPVMGKDHNGKDVHLKEEVSWGSISEFRNHALSNDKVGPEISSVDHLYGDERAAIVFEDVRPKGVNKLVRHNFSPNDYDVVWYIKAPIDRLPDIKTQLGDIADADIIMASTLETPPAVPRTVVKSEIKKLWKITGFNRWGSYHDSETTVDLADGGVYVMSYASSVLPPGKEDSPTSLGSNHASTMLTAAYGVGLVPLNDLYRVNSSHGRSVLKNDKWVNVWSLVLPSLAEWDKLKPNNNSLVAVHAMQSIVGSPSDRNILSLYNRYKVSKDSTERMEILQVTSPFAAMIKQIDIWMAEALLLVDSHNKMEDDAKTDPFKVAEKCGDWLNLMGNAKSLNLVTNSVTDPSIGAKKVSDLFTKIKATYPLIYKIVDHLGHYDTRFSPVDVVHYVNMSDSSKALVKAYNS